MTTKKQLNRAVITKSYWPSARYAARDAAKAIGAEWMGGSLVRTDECICEVKRTRKGGCYVVEA